MAKDQWHIICPCNNCSGQIEFPYQQVGKTIQCPNCGMDTLLFDPKNKQGTLSRSLTVQAVKKRVGQNTLVSICLGLVGVALLFAIPIGTFVGIILIGAAVSISGKWICSSCGNKISGKEVKICPHCKSAFE
jgi:DNA-directed RNA polymerase subunit RPC12/RpoP